ncbi:peptidoglycan-binding protein [Lyngbya aestuarii]|uniref:peptidoglycan-binding protein n=1 Tax=Lyngbya aestuarii TaxID=118322 RepID=UPI00403E11FE
MDTLAYFHLAANYEAPTNLELGTTLCYRLCLQELDRVKRLKVNSLSLMLFSVALFTLIWTNSAQAALRRGSSGSEITSLQNNLQAIGYYDGPVTGYYGSLTQEAVFKFQKANELTPDGVVGPETSSALSSKLAKPTPSQPATPPPVVSSPIVTDKTSAFGRPNVILRRGYRSSLVTSLQKNLQIIGYYNGPVTGYYGSLTQEAVTKFQTQMGLTPDGIAGPVTLSALESGSAKTASSKVEAPVSEFNQEPFIEKPNNSRQEQSNLPKKPNNTSPEKPNNTLLEEQSKPQDNQQASANSPTQMTLKKTIAGKISPKSVVHSGNGLFFAQNMMYSHTITVYDRDYNLVKTIPDSVNLAKYGYSKFDSTYNGAPVEASFSHNGKYAWVSNYKMYGSGFNNPGDDECSPAQNTDNSFLYRINTDNLNIEKVIQVGSVPKFVAASPDDRLILVTNWCSWDLSVVDTEKNLQVKKIKLGRYPRGIVINSASEKAYIAVMGSSDVAAVNLKDFSVEWLKNIGSSPRHLNIDPADRYLYTTLNGEGKVAKIDLSTGKVLKKVTTGNAPRSMTISDDGQFLYVVNYHSNTVSKVRTSDMKVLQSVNVNANPIGITYDPETKEVWVACYSGSILVFQG